MAATWPDDPGARPPDGTSGSSRTPAGPTDTCTRYGVAGWEGYLAVAHTRMATESAVTVLHSHPFVPSRDLCVVHNGSFSNYATVRRHLMADGVRFDSDNDSEVAARYLAERLASGRRPRGGHPLGHEGDGRLLHPGHLHRRRDVRGPGRLRLQAGRGGRNRWLRRRGSEYRALAELPGIAAAEVFEPQPEEVYTWSR